MSHNKILYEMASFKKLRNWPPIYINMLCFLGAKWQACLAPYGCLLTFNFYYPLISTRVSNELGAGRPYLARLAVYASLLIVSIEGFSVATALILGHNFLGYLYSNKHEVVKYVGEMAILIAVSHFIDGIQSVLSGTYCYTCSP